MKKLLLYASFITGLCSTITPSKVHGAQMLSNLPKIALNSAVAVGGMYSIPLISTFCHEALGHALAAKLLYNASSKIFIGDFSEQIQYHIAEYLTKLSPNQLDTIVKLTPNKKNDFVTNDLVIKMNQKVFQQYPQVINISRPWWLPKTSGGTLHDSPILSIPVILAGPFAGLIANIGMYSLSNKINIHPFVNTCLKLNIIFNGYINICDLFDPSPFATDGTKIREQLNISSFCYNTCVALLMASACGAWLFKDKIYQTAQKAARPAQSFLKQQFNELQDIAAYF